jgi:hypothetical protein
MIDVSTYSQDGLDNIKSVSILTEKDLKTMELLQTQLQDTFNKRQIFRTDTEARYSVLTDMKFPTPASKYWQSVREQNVHFTNLMYESCEYEERQAEIELIEAEIEELSSVRGLFKHISSSNKAIIKIKQSQIKKKQFQLLDMKRIAQDRVREVQQWEIIKQEQVKKDNTFDTKNANTHQFESFTQRFKNELQVAKDSNNKDLFKASVSQLVTLENRRKEEQKELEDSKECGLHLD